MSAQLSGLTLDEIKEDLLNTIAESMLITQTFIDLDFKYKAGQISAEEVIQQYAMFLLPAAMLSMGVHETFGPVIATYITQAEETFDMLREAMVA